MKKRLLLIGIVCLMLFTVACGKKKAPTLVGTWKNTGIITKDYIFNQDGSGVLKYNGFEIKFTYTTNGDKLSIVTKLGTEETKEYTYSLTQDTLNMKSKTESLELKRQ